MGRWAARRDANESEIVDALEAVGATVQRLDVTGAPDLVVGYRGVNTLLEVKTAEGKLTKAQKKWHPWWRGQVVVVTTVDEALEAIGAEVG